MSKHTNRKENDMRTPLTKLLAGLTAVAALAFGGSALAGAASKSSPPAPPAVTAPADTTQQGDQTAPDVAGASESASESATESSSEAASSESASANDGPGGHADDPANAGLDYQFQGEQ
jgi:hypothetical protein